jgi:hypothetical protein
MRRTSRLAPILAAAAAAAAAVAACGSAASPPRPAPAAAAAAGRQPASRPPAPAIGATQRVKARGATLSITVTKVIDPLRGSGAALLRGTRAVGVLVRIRNRGPGVYDSSSSGDISVVPSSGAASVAYAARGPCMTMDRDFDNQIGPGETRSGCVAFALAAGARVAAARFAADGGGAGVARWRAGP